MKIVVLEQSEARSRQLMAALESYLFGDGQEATFVYLHPQAVFKQRLPADTALAFITVNNMADVEVVRQFYRLYSQTPFVVISDSEEYAVESFRFPAKGYLIWPFDGTAINLALRAV